MAMATAVKITQIGNSVGIVLPKEILAELNVQKGDSLYLVKSSEGFTMTAYESDFAAKIDMLEEVMRENRDVLRRLAE
jgi:putative addiction module antidote